MDTTSPRPGPQATACLELPDHATDDLWWPNGAELRVYCVDADAVLAERIEYFAQAWCLHANLKLEFGQDRNAEVRLSVGDTPRAAWLGSHARSAPFDAPTVALGGISADVSDAVLGPLVQHAFGHVLGLHHSDHGGASVMQQSCGEGAISVADARAAAMAYPHPVQQSTPLFIGGPAHNAELASPFEVDVYQLDVGVAGVYTIETGGATDTMMALYAEDGVTKLDEDDDGGFSQNSRICARLDPGRYMVRVWHWSAAGTGRYGIWARSGP